MTTFVSTSWCHRSVRTPPPRQRRSRRRATTLTGCGGGSSPRCGPKAATSATPPSSVASDADGRDDDVARRWQDEFEALPRPITPTLVLPDGSVSRGLGALARLAEFVAATPSTSTKGNERVRYLDHGS